MFDSSQIISFFSKNNFDVRIKGGNPRFIDQKCTPDMISFIADCIVNLNKDNFCRNDIWKSSYFTQNIPLFFDKVSPRNKNANNEYDKVISQPLDLFSYAGLLEKKKIGRTNTFRILNLELLEFISIRDKNAFLFLHHYLLKVLDDSGIFKYIKEFLNNQDKDSFKILKEKFIKFIVATYNLGIRGSVDCGRREASRIFTKIINIFACWNNAQGTKGGHISKKIITYPDIVYNRVNFRDIGKLKNVTRKEQKGVNFNTAYKYNQFLMTKAIRWIKQHHLYSEVKDKLYGKTATVHHIFPKSDFPIISYYIENLIALTAGQHMDCAHPNGNTKDIDNTYQFICLKAKSKTIETEISQGNLEYSKNDFIFVLNTGFCKKVIIPIEADFKEINNYIDLYYKIS